MSAEAVTIFAAVEPCGCVTGAAEARDLLPVRGRRIVAVAPGDARLDYIGHRCTAALRALQQAAESEAQR